MKRILGGLIMTALCVPSCVFARTPNDPRYDDLWYLSRIGAPQAWDVTTGSRDVVVAVLDTGMRATGNDVGDNLWRNSGEIADNAVDDDGNGFVDDVWGWDFVDDDAVPEPELELSLDPESQAHGSIVAGVIGAMGNNRVLGTGIAWRVRIMPLRILNENGVGSETDAAAAIAYAVAQGADVINLSFVGDDAHTALRRAVQQAYAANVVIVAALGNDARNVNERPVYPACLRSELEDWVIGVAASDLGDGETVFTNYGSNCADLAAPGVDVYGPGFDDPFVGPWEGTSLASPMVAGAAALLRSVYPELHVEQVRLALKLGVDPVQTISGVGALGAGRLNVARALEVAGELVRVQPEVSVQPQPSGGDDQSQQPERDFAGVRHSYIALGAREGNAPRIDVWRADNTPYASFLAFHEAFLGGVHVAVDDLDDDNTLEVVATPGVGGGPQVRVFTVSGALRTQFFAYDEASREGVFAALGDVDGDDVEEIVTAVGGGVSNDIIVFDTAGHEMSRFPAEGFVPGTRLGVAVADVDRDWEKEIVVFAQNNEPRVVVYDTDGTRMVDFLAFGPDMASGLSLGVGDFTGDARDEIVVSPLSGRGQVRIFTGIGAVWGEFFVGDEEDVGGAMVAVADIDIDGAWDIVTAPHAGAGDIEVWTPGGLHMGALRGRVGNTGAWMSAW